MKRHKHKKDYQNLLLRVLVYTVEVILLCMMELRNHLT